MGSGHCRQSQPSWSLSSLARFWSFLSRIIFLIVAIISVVGIDLCFGGLSSYLGSIHVTVERGLCFWISLLNCLIRMTHLQCRFWIDLWILVLLSSFSFCLTRSQTFLCSLILTFLLPWAFLHPKVGSSYAWSGILVLLRVILFVALLVL